MKRLDGVRIAVTRAAAQSAELTGPLEAAGARVFVCPLIRITGSVDEVLAERVLRGLREFSWIVFTSVNGVEHLMQLLRDRRIDAEVLRSKKIACVGPATAAAAERYALPVTVIPDDFVGVAVAGALAATGRVAGEHILIARAAGGGPQLPAELRGRGAIVEDFELYRAELDAEGAARLNQLVRDGQIDLLTFTSGSAVNYFVETVGTPKNMAVAAIGPSTAEVARSHGMRVDIIANPHTTAGLITAILEYFAAERGTWRSDAGE